MSRTNTTRWSASEISLSAGHKNGSIPLILFYVLFFPVEKQGADSSFSSSCSWLDTRLLDSCPSFLLEQPNILAGKSHILTSSDDPCYPLVIVVTYNRFNSLIYIL